MKRRGRPRRKRARMKVVNPNATGIDIGSEVHYVARTRIIEAILDGERDSWVTNSFKTTNVVRQFLRRSVIM